MSVREYTSLTIPVYQTESGEKYCHIVKGGALIKADPDAKETKDHFEKLEKKMRQSDNPARTVIEESLDLTSKERKQFRSAATDSLFTWIGDLFRRRKEVADNYYLRDTGASFPAEADEAAFDGILGDITNAICSRSSVKPEAVLAQLIAITGILLRRGLYFSQAGEHHCNLYTVVSGKPASGKGESLGYVKGLVSAAFPAFMPRFQSGFKSGEKLIDAVGDEVTQTDKETGEEIVIHPNEQKELVIDEEELASLFISGKREGNVITTDLRRTWDSPEKYQTQSRGAPRETTKPHIGLVGNITPDELKRVIGHNAHNGFASRVLWIACERKRSCSRPQAVKWESEGEPMLKAYKEMIHKRYGKTIEYTYTPEGEKYWDNVIHRQLERQAMAHGGMMGEILARGMPTVLRLAMIYAAMDDKDQVDVCHLKSAKALWDYSARSALWIFSDASGNYHADKIIQALRQAHPGYMNRTQINKDAFNGKIAKTDLDKALGILRKHQQANFVKVAQEERWRAEM